MCVCAQVHLCFMSVGTHLYMCVCVDVCVCLCVCYGCGIDVYVCVWSTIISVYLSTGIFTHVHMYV